MTPLDFEAPPLPARRGDTTGLQVWPDLDFGPAPEATDEPGISGGQNVQWSSTASLDFGASPSPPTSGEMRSWKVWGDLDFGPEPKAQETSGVRDGTVVNQEGRVDFGTSPVGVEESRVQLDVRPPPVGTGIDFGSPPVGDPMAEGESDGVENENSKVNMDVDEVPPMRGKWGGVVLDFGPPPAESRSREEELKMEKDKEREMKAGKDEREMRWESVLKDRKLTAVSVNMTASVEVEN